VPRKGFDILIRALKILQTTFGHRDLYLAIVGDGEERIRLELLARSLVLRPQ